MIKRLQSSIPDFNITLSETIVWCSSQPFECNPAAAVQVRREMADEAAQLLARSERVSRFNPARYVLRKKAERLSRRADPGAITPPLAAQLRSPILDPGLDSLKGFPPNPVAQKAIVQKVAARRADRLRRESRHPAKPAGDLWGGRILFYAPNENVCDGASEYASKGFFDLSDAPPWDTWVCFFDAYVVSWIPPQLLALAQAGIDINVVDCIFWAKES